MNKPLHAKLKRDLWQRKGALLALLIMIAIGLGSYIGMSNLWQDLDGARHRYYQNYHLADFSIDLKQAPEYSLQTLNMANLKQLYPRINVNIMLDLPNIHEPLTGTALSLPDVRRPILNDVLLKRGSWFSSSSQPEIIVNDDFAKAHQLQLGQRINITLLGQQYRCLIVGTAISPEFVYLLPADGGIAPDPARFGVVYFKHDFLQQHSQMQGAYNQLLGTVHQPDNLPQDLQLLSRKLDRYGVLNAIPSSQLAPIQFLNDELMGLKIQATVMPTLFLSVAILVLNIIMGRLVKQQRTIIGTLRALGYSAWQISQHYLLYGLLLGVMGGILGIAFGIWLQNLVIVNVYQKIFSLPNLTSQWHSQAVINSLMLSLLFAIVGTIKGVYNALQLQPADAMRPPPPEISGKVLLEYLPPLWQRLSFYSKMIFRSIFRNPFRSAVSIIASAIATALILTALTTNDALNYLMDYEFNRVSHQDITVILRKPVTQAANELNQLPNINFTEPQLVIQSDMQHGPWHKRTGVIGLNSQHHLNTPLDQTGQAIIIPEQGLVLSRKLAEILNVKIGETIQLRPLTGRRTQVDALITGIVDSYLGLSAYAERQYLARLLGEIDVANQLLSSQNQANPPITFYQQLKQRPQILGISQRLHALHQLDKTFGETMGAILVVLIFFSGMIAFGSVLNAALVEISERQREIGTLRVLGYTPWQITRILAQESYLLNSLGIGLGIILGIMFSIGLSNAYSTELYRFPVVINNIPILITIATMLVFISIAQLIIYRMIIKFHWLEVLNIKE